MNAITSILNASVHVDTLDPEKRNYGYILRKSTEELGELSTEVQIKLGESYKSPGSDGITGEAIDLMVTAVDMIYADNKDKLSVLEIEELINARVVPKLQKWIKSISK